MDKPPQVTYGEIGVDIILLLLDGSPPNRLLNLLGESEYARQILDYAVKQQTERQKSV